MFTKILAGLKKAKTAVAAVALAVGGYVLSAYATNAAVPSATSTLDTIMGSIIGTSVDLVTKIFADYWPWILVIGVISGLVGVFAKFAHLGSKR